MEKKYICDVPEKEASDFLDFAERKSAIESLALIIAQDNSILKENSDLYKRLIEDYKELKRIHEEFWATYMEKYGSMLDDKSQFYLDFKTNKIYMVDDL